MFLDEFGEQVVAQRAAVGCTAAVVIERSEGGAQQCAHCVHRAAIERAAEQALLGVVRAQGHRGDAAEGEPRVRHRACRIERKRIRSPRC